MVDKLSGGRIGYMHVPDMGADGIREFIKWYYPQLRKEALIVDVRANGGGNVSRMLIERLSRKLLATQFQRTVEDPIDLSRRSLPRPDGGLLDENSASDGDIFPAMFREAGLGPLIGKRSWGGVVGITEPRPADRRRARQRARVRLRQRRRASGSSKATASIRTSKSITTRPR